MTPLGGTYPYGGYIQLSPYLKGFFKVFPILQKNSEYSSNDP